MLPLRNHNGQYILSLDNLDISLLSQYIQKPSDEKRMLWTRPHLDGEASYHQVEIVQEKRNEDTELDDCETYLCHICNVNVPKTYHEEHTKSKKHQTCKKLATKLLENVAKEMNTNSDNFKKNNQRDLFYCETCCKGVSLQNKRKHAKSNYHLKCVENDKLIDSVLKMYDGKQTVSEEYNSILDADGFSDSSSEYDRPLIINERRESVTREIIDSFVKCEPKKEEFVSSLPFRSVLNTKEDIMALVKQIVEVSNCKFVMPVMQNNYVAIVTPNGSKKQISISTYFSYIDRFTYVDNFFDFCQVCNVNVHTTNIIQHIATDLHLRNILQPINNNFARKVVKTMDPTSICYPPKMHCLLCNELVDNEFEHVTKKHPHLTLTQTVPLNINKNIITTLTKYCDVCERNIGLNNFTAHTKSKKHKIKVNQSVKKTEPSLVQVKTTNTNYTKKTYCNTCNIYIDTHNFLGHYQGSKHMDNIKKNIPSVSDVKNNSTVSKTTVPDIFCEVCNVCVPSGGMAIHILGKPHKNKLAKKENK